MLLPLRVREVRALVGVESKTETTFEGTEMVTEDIRVLNKRGSGIWVVK